MPEGADDLKKLGIGRKIRTLRDQKCIDLDVLSKETGHSKVLLSQIEADVVPPTVATLLQIAKILGVGIDYFFQDAETHDKIELVRAHERKRVAKTDEAEAGRLTYSYESLAYSLSHKHMEPFLVEFDMEVEEKQQPLSHEGEEFIFLIEGELEFISDDTKIVLHPGDSLYFFAKIPHILRGHGSIKPKAVIVLYPFSDNS